MLIFDQMVSQKIFGGYFLLKYPVGQIQSSTTKRTAALLSLWALRTSTRDLVSKTAGVPLRAGADVVPVACLVPGSVVDG